MRGKVTKRSVDTLKLTADAAEVTLWDSELKGFGVRLQRGGAKSYVLTTASAPAAAHRCAS